jgi:hypothetical protein
LPVALVHFTKSAVVHVLLFHAMRWYSTHVSDGLDQWSSTFESIIRVM